MAAESVHVIVEADEIAVAAGGGQLGTCVPRVPQGVIPLHAA